MMIIISSLLKLWVWKSDSPKDFWTKLNNGIKKIDLDFTNAELYNYFNGLLNTTNSNSNELVNNNDTSDITDQATLDDIALSAIDNSLNCSISFKTF